MSRKLPPGWVPRYHGAWAMVTIPILLGIALGGFVPAHLLLLGTWWVGYFAFYAIGQWLRSARPAGRSTSRQPRRTACERRRSGGSGGRRSGRSRFVRPALTYTAIAAPLGVALLVVAPFLVRWAFAFAPLVVVSAWCYARRKERSFLNDAATVTAATLTLPVAYDLATHDLVARGDLAALPGSSPDGSVTGWAWIWIVTAVVGWYFLGTIFYVKTNIRERGDWAWFLASLLFHGAGLIGVLVLNAHLRLPLALPWLCGLIAIRAVAVPAWGYHRGWLPPIAIGLGEVAISVALFLVFL
ncbi:YwiC-like family protein [Trueperella sp.]|uniref:YwiC-like family protein n=1 Tax=Trueperella sp. TaxID=2699835 RepID=UPI0022EA6C9D|nr:YwiC-like family protein [Trueperella sp.]